MRGLKQRILNGNLRPTDNALVLTMMESGDKARHYILQFLMEIKERAETTPLQLQVADRLLQWAKLQYGEKHLNVNIEMKTSIDDVFSRIEKYIEKKEEEKNADSKD